MLARAQQHVAEIAKSYPGIWKAVDVFRASRGREPSEWPVWCYLLLAGAHAIASGGRPAPLAPREAGWVGRIGALAAWRPTQEIYRYDPELLLEGLWATPLSEELPVAASSQGCRGRPSSGTMTSGEAGFSCSCGSLRSSARRLPRSFAGRENSGGIDDCYGLE